MPSESGRSDAKRPVRIAEIALSLGLSASTVSRALRRPEMVREETRMLIVEAAAKVGYAATSGAPSRSRIGTLGLLVPDIENPFFTALARAAMLEARLQGYGLVVADSNEDPLEEGESLILTCRVVDGLILASSRLADADVQGVASEMPLVVVNRELAGATTLLIDNGPGMTQAVEHLGALGHRLIAYVEGPALSWSNAQRREAFLEATRASDLEGILLGPYPPRFDGGVQAADVAVARSATAIIAYNDVMAFGVLSRLAGRGIAVPTSMSVIGFDDVPAAAIWSPSLTSISAPTAALGKAAVRNLLRLVDGKAAVAVERRRLPNHLVVRGSTATCP